MDGNALRLARESKKKTVPELAKALSMRLGKKIDEAKVARWESGIDKIPADVEGYIALSDLVFSRPQTTRAISISIANRKGGIGKTSLSVNLAYVLAGAGARVLLVDADAQSNSTLHVGIDDAEAERYDRQRMTLYDVMRGHTPAEKAIIETTIPSLSILPSYLRLATADEEMAGELELLKKNMQPVQGKYDFILYDCAPTVGAVTKNCLVCSNFSLIPVQTEPHSIAGLAKMLRTLSDFKRSANKDLEILGIVPTMHQPRVGQNKDSLLELYTSLSKTHTIFSAIPRSSTYPQSAAVGMVTVAYDLGVPGLGTFVEIATSLFAKAGATK
ncbi:MAG: AAA family ATPase [Rhodospirillaceae bacterium]